MRSLFAAVFLLLSLSVHAAELHTFELKYRTAEELMPTIQPMLAPEDAITGSGYLLFIRSDPQTLSAITSMLSQLDRAPQQLFITVDQADRRQAAESGVGISADSRQSRLEARLYDNRTGNRGNTGQGIRVLEGHWATIRTGAAVPIRTQQRWRDGSGLRHEQSIEYRDVDSGFEVRPRIQGDEVTLNIRPFRARLSEHSGGTIEQQEIMTTIRGRIGQWLEIGQSDENVSGNRQGILYAEREQSEQNSTVRLKVERIGR